MNRFRLLNARHRQIPEWILDCVQRIDEAKVRNHVESFCEIGPRCDEFPFVVQVAQTAGATALEWADIVE